MFVASVFSLVKIALFYAVVGKYELSVLLKLIAGKYGPMALLKFLVVKGEPTVLLNELTCRKDGNVHFKFDMSVEMFLVFTNNPKTLPADAYKSISRCEIVVVIE